MRRFSVLKFISDGFLSDGIPSVTSFPSPNMNSADEAYFNIEKGERGLSYRQIRCFFEFTQGRG